MALYVNKKIFRVNQHDFILTMTVHIEKTGPEPAAVRKHSHMSLVHTISYPYELLYCPLDLVITCQEVRLALIHLAITLRTIYDFNARQRQPLD